MTATTRLVTLWRLSSSPTAAAFPSKMHSLLLLLGLLALASFARGTHDVDYLHSFNKRGPFQPSELCGPGGKGNGDIVCAPTKDNNYTIPNVMRVAWNSADGEVAAINAVDIYLRRTDRVGWVGNWSNIPNEDRTYDIQLSEDWFPERKNDSIPQTFGFQVIIVPNEKDPSSGGPGTVSDEFYITRPAADVSDSNELEAVPPEPSTTTKVVTTGTPDSSNAEALDQAEEDKSPSTALVVALVVSGVLALAAIIAVIFACKSRRRLKKHRSMSNLSTNSSAPMMDMAGKEDKSDPEFTVEVSSIHSTTPLATKESAATISSMPSRSNLSSVPSVTFSSASQSVAISPSDASILSDAFRHALRKPDWENENNDDDEEEDDSALNEEERRRRKEAKQLMKMELAQEGTGLHTVQRRPTHVQVRKPVDGSAPPAGDNANDIP